MKCLKELLNRRDVVSVYVSLQEQTVSVCAGMMMHCVNDCDVITVRRFAFNEYTISKMFSKKHIKIDRVKNKADAIAYVKGFVYDYL
jgi:hypothetical protein